MLKIFFKSSFKGVGVYPLTDIMSEHLMVPLRGACCYLRIPFNKPCLEMSNFNCKAIAKLCLLLICILKRA